MKDYYLTVLVIGFGLAGVILYLVRRDHIYIRQGVFWIMVAVLSTLFGVWPSLIDVVGSALGVAYPPTLLLLVAIIVLIVKALLEADHPGQQKKEEKAVGPPGFEPGTKGL